MENLLKMSPNELTNKAKELKIKIAQMNFDKTSGKLMDTASLARTRKDLARVLTRISEVSLVR